MLIQHTLNVYKKPRQAISGNAGSPVINDEQLARYRITDYKHKISAIGGYDTASCTVMCRLSEAERIFEAFVGNRVEIYGDDPVLPCWEGLINAATLQVGRVQIRRSLDKMVNSVRVLYSNASGTPTTTSTVTLENLDSIAIYGTKQATFDFGEVYDISGVPGGQLNGPEALIRSRLRELAWPVKTRQITQDRAILLTLEFIGFYHTLDWVSYENTNTSTLDIAQALGYYAVDAFTWINDLGPNHSTTPGNGNGLFYDDTIDDYLLSTILEPWVRVERRLGESSWQYINKLAETGVYGFIDSITAKTGSQLALGISGTNPNNNARHFYSKIASREEKYTIRALGDGNVRDLYGRIVPPWTVQPDGLAIIRDILIGYSLQNENDDPRIGYISRVDYDGNTGEVALTFGDDISIEGVLGLTEQIKSTSQRFGATKRQALV